MAQTMNECLFNGKRMDEEALWRAFCTIHWFMTGEDEVWLSGSAYTHYLTNWYVHLENKLFARCELCEKWQNF
jgi:hypothetical protein